MSTSTPTPVEPLLEFLSLAATTTLRALQFAAAVLASSIKPIVSVTLIVGRALLAPVLFFLAPVLFAGGVVFDGAVRKPYRFAVQTGEELREVWVFIGVALLCGGIIGLGARAAAQGVAGALVGLQAESTKKVEDARAAEGAVRLERLDSVGGGSGVRTRARRGGGKGKRKGEWRGV